jgi:ubiquinone/menaquinone biosynthesis C-methylase UbiE
MTPEPPRPHVSSPASALSRAGRGLSGLAIEEANTLVDAIERLDRALRGTVPPVRGAPFFGVDYAPGDFAPLDALCARGIFRKYEHALHIGAGLGGPARWWATRFGCTVLGVDVSPTLVWAANRLTLRAGLGSQVRTIVGDTVALPLRDRLFTHVWAGEALGAADPATAVREAWRVLRPGAHFALYVCAPEGADRVAAPWSERLAAAGFVEVEVQAARPPQPDRTTELARARLHQYLRDARTPAATSVARRLWVAYARAEAEKCSAWVFARRP